MWVISTQTVLGGFFSRPPLGIATLCPCNVGPGFGTWWQFAQDDLLGLLSFLPVPPMCLLPICIQILCWHLQLNPIKVNLGRIPTTCGDIPLLAYNGKKLKCSVRLPIILIIYHITAVPVSINDIFFWHSSLKLNILCLRIYCNNL